MERFEQLVKALRYCKVDYCSSCLGCPMYADYEGSGCINEMHDSAAAAIEDLQAVLKEADKKQAYQHDYVCELVAEVEELKAQLPKRGEWIWDDKKCIYVCSVCGSPKVRENMDRQIIKEQAYCYSCGAKMEVQDDRK